MRGSDAGEATRIHVRTTNTEVTPRDEVAAAAASSAQKSMDFMAEKKKSMRARYAYGIIFLIPNLCAWIVRDYGQMAQPQFHYLKSCGADGRDCVHTLGVLRVSFGCFIYFSVMFLTTFRTRKLYETRNAWHSGWWTLKYFMLIVSLVVPIFFPSGFIQLYGELARVGAGIFLLLQLISVIQFINWWNKYWMPDEEKKQSCSLGLFMSTLFYIASVCGLVYMYATYGTKTSCSLNIFFISWTAILLIVMMAISLHSKVNRGLLSSGIMAAYVIYLCWSALRSEPANEKCYKHKEVIENGDWTTIVSFLIAICAIVMATFSTGIDSESFQFRKDEVKEEDDIPYKWSIDIGWASTWVKIVNEWFAATIYVWTLISPVVKQSKLVSCEEAGGGGEERIQPALP
ncbi:uncharacterized protein LOC133816777 isoform X2 [Humulus lupulus]|uniref:uncharacterized protein LOC133816777 isoform X2 n=1 Tax=Humulus lupulus TaxID=3486 RepID=UPI002B4181E4|nr:uncharacterized protein LOC133816777 isoform X2 [Humulus lupulus]